MVVLAHFIVLASKISIVKSQITTIEYVSLTRHCIILQYRIDGNLINT